MAGEIRSTKADSRLAGADFVRATACLMVLVHHLVQRLSPEAVVPAARSAYLFALEGAFGVAAFFVLSGYLLARPFWQALDAGAAMPSLRTYALRRTARIVPAFWLALTVSFILSVVLFEVPFDGTLLLRYLAGLFLVSDWHWSTLFPVEFNGPLWSIGFEVTSYVLLPFCLAVLFWFRPTGVWPRRFVWVAVIVAVVLAHWLIVRHLPVDTRGRGWQFGLQGGAKVWVPRFNPFGFFAIFAIGTLAAGLQVRWARSSSLLFDALALAGLALAIWSMTWPIGHRDIEGYGFAQIPYAYPWFPLAVGLVLATLPSSALLGRLADNAVAVFLARISFGIYVWHFLVIETLRQVWLPSLTHGGISDIGTWLAACAAVSAISIALGTASFYLLENPVIRWARTFERPQPSGRAPRPADERARAGIRAMPARES